MENPEFIKAELRRLQIALDELNAEKVRLEMALALIEQGIKQQ